MIGIVNVKIEFLGETHCISGWTDVLVEQLTCLHGPSSYIAALALCGYDESSETEAPRCCCGRRHLHHCRCSGQRNVGRLTQMGRVSVCSSRWSNHTPGRARAARTTTASYTDSAVGQLPTPDSRLQVRPFEQPLPILLLSQSFHSPRPPPGFSPCLPASPVSLQVYHPSDSLGL